MKAVVGASPDPSPTVAVGGAASEWRTADPGSWKLWLAILVTGLLARLAFVAVVPRAILWPDGLGYDEVARLLVEHGTYGMQTLRPPGYPTFIAGVYRVFGESLLALRLVEAVLGTITVGLVGLIGARLFGARAGLIAAALTAVHPVLAFLPSTQYSENVAVLVITLALGTAFEGWRKGGWWRWAVTGVLCGAATLIRPNVVTMFLGLALGFVALFTRDRRSWLVPILITISSLVLVVAPWIARNHHVHDRWFFISTGGGRQFWYGNNSVTTGVTWILPPFDSTMLAELGREPDEFARERLLYRKGVEFIRAHPAKAAQLYVVKLGNLFALYPETLSTTYINRWSRWAQGLASAVIFAGALIGLARWRSMPALWPLVGAVVGYALVNALFFGGLRYRLVFEPCLLLVAGVGWSGVWDRFAGARMHRGR